MSGEKFWGFDIHFEGKTILLAVVTENKVVEFEMSSLTDTNPRKIHEYKLEGFKLAHNVKVRTNGFYIVV